MDDLDKHLSIMNAEALYMGIWRVNSYLCHLWETYLMCTIVIHHMEDAGLMDEAG